MVTSVKLGSGEFAYEVVVGWEKPAGLESSWREVAGVVTDADDNVYVFNRGDHPMVVFDRDGNFIKSWGEGVFTRAHGITAGPDNTLYCTDDGDHTVRQCTLDGEIVMTIGVPERAGATVQRRSVQPLHSRRGRSRGRLPVRDRRIRQQPRSQVHAGRSADQVLGRSLGTDPGQFNIVHNIAADRDGYLYVCDRENHRIQVFNREGGLEDVWHNVHRPCAIYIDDDQRVYVGELGWGMSVNRDTPNIGPRVSIMTTSGRVLERLGCGYGLDVGQFIAPHGICVDSRKSIYVGEVSHTSMSHTTTPPDNVRSLQKLDVGSLIMEAGLRAPTQSYGTIGAGESRNDCVSVL